MPRIVLLLMICAMPAFGGTAHAGFDRNDYPGDDKLAALRKTFDYTGYWLNNPPGAKSNTWAGKRRALLFYDFGFLVLFNGRPYAELKAGDPAKIGALDAAEAANAAQREGFPSGTIIFLDQEEGGRLLPEQRDYLHAWVDRLTRRGFRAGVYCSGVPFKEGSGATVVTAEDIKENAGGRDITFWVSNDACGPSPGCMVAPLKSKAGLNGPPQPSESGVGFAAVWQYAQSPRRSELTQSCAATYHRDGNCYPPGVKVHLDLNTATSDDPSHGK